MKLDYFLLFVLGVFIGGVMTSSLIPVDSSIPPTRAFSKVTMAGQSINASSYSDELEIVLQGVMTSSISDNTITIKLKQDSCPVSQSITGVDASGNWICDIP